MDSLYSRIIELTNKKGISGKELGTLLGLKKSPLTDWKNKKSKPTIEQLCMLCDIFATSADYLLFGKTKDITCKSDLSKLKKYDNPEAAVSFISLYQQLSSEDKDDVKDFIEYKLYKSQKKIE